MAGPNFQSNVFTNQFVPDATGRALVSTESNKYTYKAGAVAKTFYNTAAAVLCEIQGSATMTVRVKFIRIWGQVATTANFAELTLLRCTTVGGGTPAAITGRPLDTNDVAATAVVNVYTGASTQGTGHLLVGAQIMYCSAAGVTAPAATVFDFCRNNDKPLILRGTSDWLEVYNNSTSVGTGTFGFEIEWEEDNS
ncbi:MAG: hypothetical protein WAN11_21740 [Syntrophobacteraceae bacterium]